MIVWGNAQVTFDAEEHAWYISLDKDRGVSSTRTEEVRGTVLLDYDENGDVQGIEIL